MKIVIVILLAALLYSCSVSNKETETDALVDELLGIENVDQLDGILDKMGSATTILDSKKGNFSVTFPVGKRPKSDTLIFKFRDSISLYRDFIELKNEELVNQYFSVAYAPISGVNSAEQIDELFSAYLNFMLSQTPSMFDAEYMNDNKMRGELSYLEDDKAHLMLDFRLIFEKDILYVLEVKSLKAKFRNVEKREFFESFRVK